MLGAAAKLGEVVCSPPRKLSVSAKKCPVATLEDRGSSGALPYARRLGTVFGSSIFRGAPYLSREGSVGAEIENEAPDILPVPPPEKQYL